MKFLSKKIKPLAFILLAATYGCNANQLIESASQPAFNATPMQSMLTRNTVSAHWKKYISEPFFKLDKKYQIGIGVLGAAVGVTAAGYFGYKAFNNIHDKYDRVGAARRAVQRGDINRLRLAAQRALAQERSDIIDACTSDAQREAVSDVFLAKPDFDEQQKMMMLFPVPRGTFNQGADYIFLNRMYESLKDQSPTVLLAWIFNNRCECFSYCIPTFIRTISASFDANYRSTFDVYANDNPIVTLCNKMPVMSAAGETRPDLVYAFNALFLENPQQNIDIYSPNALPEIIEQQKACLKSLAQNFMEHAQDMRHALNFIYLCNFVGFTPTDWAPFRNFRCRNINIHNICISRCKIADDQAAPSESSNSSLLEEMEDETEAKEIEAELAELLEIIKEDAREAIKRNNSRSIELLKIILSGPGYPKEDLPKLLAFAKEHNSSQEVIDCIQLQTIDNVKKSARKLIRRIMKGRKKSSYLEPMISKHDYPKEDLPELLAFAQGLKAPQDIIACIERHIPVRVEINGEVYELD